MTKAFVIWALWVLFFSPACLAAASDCAGMDGAQGVRALRQSLLKFNYADLYEAALGPKYGIVSLHRVHSQDLQIPVTPSPQRSLADLLMLGMAIQEEEFENIGLNKTVRQKLECQNILERTGARSLRLKNLRVEAYKFRGEPVFFFIHAPHLTQIKEPSRLFISSYALMAHLNELVDQDLAQLQGRWVDFGSGSGFLGISILAQDRKSRRISQMIGLEIIPELADISALNAVLNNVEDRFTVLLNDDPTRLARHLKNKKVDFVISNPPSLPNPLKTTLPLHSSGGRMGYDVLDLSIRQLFPHMSPRGQMLFFAMLALDKQKRPYFIDSLSRLPELKNTRACATLWRNHKLIQSPLEHAYLLRSLIIDATRAVTSISAILLELEIARIEGISPYFVSVSAAGTPKKCLSEKTLKTIDPYL